MNHSNYEGMVFGRLIVRLDLGMVANESKTCTRRTVIAECLNCSSGVKRYILANLKLGKTTSCGCLRKEIVSKAVSKHKKTKTTTHTIWTNMKQRCGNPNRSDYKHYGGRGITVCQRWKDSFENFLADMGERPQKMQIDRIDNNKGYSPENCRWVTASENNLNKRKKITNTSGKTGIYFNKSRNKWAVQITKNKKVYYLGLFENLEDVIERRKQAELEFFGYTKE